MTSNYHHIFWKPLNPLVSRHFSWVSPLGTPGRCVARQLEWLMMTILRRWWWSATTGRGLQRANDQLEASAKPQKGSFLEGTSHEIPYKSIWPDVLNPLL